jgi:hypothetical protein
VHLSAAVAEGINCWVGGAIGCINKDAIVHCQASLARQSRVSGGASSEHDNIRWEGVAIARHHDKTISRFADFANGDSGMEMDPMLSVQQFEKC